MELRIHKDDDMRRYSWSVLSATLAIFVSVMSFRLIHVPRFTENRYSAVLGYQ